MKTLRIIFLILLSAFRLPAQNVDNPSFDSVYIGAIDRIHQWITSDAWVIMAGDTVPGLNPNDHYISGSLQYHEALWSVQVEYSNAFDGPLAVKILSIDSLIDSRGNHFRGFVANGDHFYTDSLGYIDFAKGGVPFPYRPYSFHGYYKYNDQSPSLSNYPQAIVILKKYNAVTQSSDTVGFAYASMQLFPTNTWRRFELPIIYYSNDVPDSLVVAFTSPGLMYPGTLWLDSLGFDYSFPSSIKEEEDPSKIFFIDREGQKLVFFDEHSIESIQIFGMTGQLVLKIQSPKKTIDLSRLAKGNYLLNLRYSDNRVRTIKFDR